MKQKIDFFRWAYKGMLSYLDNPHDFEVSVKSIGEFRLQPLPDGRVDIWFQMPLSGFCGYCEIDPTKPKEEMAQELMQPVINTLGWPHAEEFRELIQTEVFHGVDDFCLTMSD